MRICLFDWNVGGHHEEVAKAWASALDPGPEVVLAMAGPTLAGLRDTASSFVDLGSGRPRPVAGPGGKTSKGPLAERELDLLSEVIADVEPDHTVLLWADPVLRWLLRRPPYPTALSLCIGYSELHYPWRYRTFLSPREWASAAYKELNVFRWTRRRDAHALFALDPIAAARWAHYPGARSYALEEPPLTQAAPCRAPAERSGCVLFGYLDERKGIDRLAAALEQGCEGLELTLLGEVAPDYAERLDASVARMRAGGVSVTTRFERALYADALACLAGARVALLSFGWVGPGSRVLLEAAAAGTPVVGPEKGAVGHLIRANGLGLTADPTHPGELRRAIRELATDAGSTGRYAEAARAYAAKHDGGAYRRRIRQAFDLPPAP